MKILIIGIVASGKTTLAKELAEYYGIVNYEIDSIVHDDLNHRKRSNEEQDNLIRRIDIDDNWIMEGTLRKNLYYLLEMADQVVYLDIPLKVRKRRIVGRFIKQKLKIEKCNYKPTLKMLKNMFNWTNDFENNRDQFEKYLGKYKDKLVILRSTKEIREFINK